MNKRKKNQPNTMKNNFFYLLLFLILFAGCKEEDSSSCYSNTDARPIVHDGIEREYILFIPNSYDPASPTPMVFNFHGFGGSAEAYMMEADLRSEAEANGFVLVYPQGSCLDGASHWNVCPLGADNKSTADDFGFIETMISEISSEYNVDANRIYAAGYSNGGMMAYGLANYRSSLIAAVASISGTMLDCIGPTNHPMPVIHLHGTSDGVIPYNGGNEFNSTQNVLDHWISFNNTNATPTVASYSNGGRTIEHYLYSQGDSNVAVEHYKYIGGDHIWFNWDYEGMTTSQLVWDFLSKYDLNGLR